MELMFCLRHALITCILHPSNRCVVPSFQCGRAPSLSFGLDNDASDSFPFIDQDDTFFDNYVQLQPSLSEERSSCNYDHEHCSTTSSQFASRIVQHYVSPSDDDGLSESRPSQPILRRLHQDDKQLEAHTNREMHWADLFIPLYGNCSPTPTQVTNIDNKKIQPRKRKKEKRTNLKLTLAYRGQDFCGWEDQRHSLGSGDSSRFPQPVQLPSVQGMLVDILHPLLGRDEHDDRKTLTKRPIEIKVAGRTDAGVSAIGQVCRIRTWKKLTLAGGKTMEDVVRDYVNDSSITNSPSMSMTPTQPSLRVLKVECVDDNFHPTFGAMCRAYTYLIDVNENCKNENVHDDKSNNLPTVYNNTSDVLVQKLSTLLGGLEGKELDYIALSYGKVKSQTTLCTLHHARACLVEWAHTKECIAGASRGKQQAICIELVGDRFLRRMVRILVATAMREAYRDSDVRGNVFDDKALLNIVLSQDRDRRACAAPPDGLIFVGASFGT